MTQAWLPIAIVVSSFLIIQPTVFHYQRFTLTVARKVVLNSGMPLPVGAVQIAMTPTWIGALGWLGTGLLVVGAGLFIKESVWVGVVVFVAYGLFGMGLADVVWPVPTQRQCLSLALRSAQRELRRATEAMAGSGPKAEEAAGRMVFLMMILSELGER